MKEAKAKGLLDKLTAPGKKKITVSRSDARTKARKNAIRKFLEKNEIEFDETTVTLIEKHVTQHSTPEDVFKMANVDMRAKKYLKEKL